MCLYRNLLKLFKIKIQFLGHINYISSAQGPHAANEDHVGLQIWNISVVTENFIG